jgi:hypothetical protein
VLEEIGSLARVTPARAALEGHAGDIAGVPGGDGVQDEGQWSEGKTMPLSSCSIASRCAAEVRLETIPGVGRFGWLWRARSATALNQEKNINECADEREGEGRRRGGTEYLHCAGIGVI